MATKSSSILFLIVVVILVLALSAMAARLQLDVEAEADAEVEVEGDPPAPSCKRYECPDYNTTDVAADFEIRRYAAGGAWIATEPVTVDHGSFRNSTRVGFLQLLGYVKGNNTQNRPIPMTAPAITDVAAACGTSFVVRLPLASSAVADPPAPDPADHLQFRLVSREWCAAVSRFGGFATDDVVPQEAALLRDSLAGTRWADRTVSPCAGGALQYSVAQYNNPFEEQNRVNEIWFLWDAPADSGSGSC